MDPLQFAYQPGIGVDNAIIFLLHKALSHLKKPGSTVMIMFFDLSSAFNTIQPALLGDKFEAVGVDNYLICSILDYLTNHPQCVRTQGCVSNTVVCCMYGGPTRNSSGSVPLRPLYCRLQSQLTSLSPAKVLR